MQCQMTFFSQRLDATSACIGCMSEKGNFFDTSACFLWLAAVTCSPSDMHAKCGEVHLRANHFLKDLGVRPLSAAWSGDAVAAVCQITGKSGRFCGGSLRCKDAAYVVQKRKRGLVAFWQRLLMVCGALLDLARVALIRYVSGDACRSVAVFAFSSCRWGDLCHFCFSLDMQRITISMSRFCG